MLLKYWWVEFLCVDRSIKELQSHWQTQKSTPICFQIGNQPWLLKPIWKSKGDNDLKYLYVYVNRKLDCRQCLRLSSMIWVILLHVLPITHCNLWTLNFQEQLYSCLKLFELSEWWRRIDRRDQGSGHQWWWACGEWSCLTWGSLLPHRTWPHQTWNRTLLHLLLLTPVDT